MKIRSKKERVMVKVRRKGEKKRKKRKKRTMMTVH